MTTEQEWIDRITETDFVTCEDGSEVYWPTGHSGFLTSHALRMIADELDKMNGPWDDRIEEYFDTHSYVVADAASRLVTAADIASPDFELGRAAEFTPWESLPDFRQFCVGCGFEHGPAYADCVWNKDIG